MNLRGTPTEDRVVIKQYDDDEKTSGGIYIPESSQGKQYRGKVMAVGPGRHSDTGEIIPPTVQVGDEVFYGKYSGVEISIDEEEYVIINERDILFIITETPQLGTEEEDS